MELRYRLWRLISHHGRLIAVLLVLGAVITGVYAYDRYRTPVVEQQTVQTDSATFETEVSASARVTRENPLYETGTRLEDRSLYLMDASPELRLQVTTTVPDDRPVDIEQRLVLELRGTRNGEPFWTERRTLTDRSGTIENGSLVMTGTLNVSRLRDEFNTLTGYVTTVGSFQSTLLLTVQYDTDRYEGQLETGPELIVTSNAYWVAGELTASSTERTTETRTVRRRPPRTAFGLPALLALGLHLAGVGIGLAHRQGRFDTLRSDEEITRRRYEEWISTGEFPTGSGKRYVRINDLVGLVDVAIDSDKRVIYDETMQAYAVVDGDIVYYYAAHEDLHSWLDI